jgi:hypothetical protein
MVEWVASETELRAPDSEGAISFDAVEWDGSGGDEARDRSLASDGAVRGSAAGLRTRGAVSLATADGGRVRDGRSMPIDLPNGGYRLSFPTVRPDGAARTPCERDDASSVIGASSMPAPPSGAPGSGTSVYVRFTGPARVRRTDDGLAISFPERSAIAIGGGDRTEPERVVVPETTEGVATALTHASSALRTAGPERSHPEFRTHPPLVSFGDRTQVSKAVRRATPATGLRFLLPDSIEAVLVAAPLAYYLGATVEVGDRSTPLLEAPEIGFEREFRPMPALQHDIAATLQRVFLLDCLSRAIDPGEVTPAGGSALDRIGVRRDGLNEATPAERLRRYCEVPSTRIRPELPEWHLSTYVEPAVENASSLPYLLDDLSLVYLPSSSELDGRGLIRRSLDDFYRAGEVASADRLEPELHAGRAHGWLAPGTPIDVFKTLHRAYEHRPRYEADESPLDVTVVFNDPEMGGEHSRVAEIYRERAADLPANVTVREGLRKSELRTVFETSNDFVHFIGHCDVDGLRCPDGSFPTASLDACRTRTFFLNACGSYREGLGLVEAGSVAGAVTLTAVLNDHAATVGTSFARLLIYGFDIERAIQLARRRIIMGKDYAVVGDGTHTLAAGEHGPPPVAWLERRDDRYHLTHEVVATGTTGGTFRPPCGDDDRAYLHGANTDVEFGCEALVSFLDDRSIPVIYDGDFHWSTDLAERLRP